MEGGILCSILDLLRDAINYQQTDKPEIVEDESRMLNFFYWEKSQVNQKTSVSFKVNN